jgi:2-polyprenyl-3-methyl-5-hydroxy-6-metoxy-1,4-benzoquinol methylase
MVGRAWNHNIHYHDIVLRALPSYCQRVLDIGCGQGLLARQLAAHGAEVMAIDSDSRSPRATEMRVTFVEGDFMTYPFTGESFDAISIVATLHHLPLRPALTRLRSLLRPGGVLVVVGLYRQQTLWDYALAGVALPASWFMRSIRRYVSLEAPTRNPRESLREIRIASQALLPGATLKRRLFFRYSLIWHKP